MRWRDALTVDDFRQMARARMPKMVFDYIDGGVEDEFALAANIEAFRRKAFVPRYLVNVEHRNHRTSLFGRTYDRSFGISPTGFASLFRPGADLMLARAAAKARIPFVLSGASNISVETVAKAAPGYVWFQVYGARDRKITRDLLKRATGAGVETLVVTVDVPVTPKRTRNIRNGFGLPPRMSLSTVLQALLHPGWTARYLLNGGLPKLGNWQPYAPQGASALEIARVFACETPNPTQSLEDIATIRESWKGTLLVKGILHPDDAVEMMKLGADGIWVSNHGGRQLDRIVPSIDALPAIRQAVGGEATLVIDSGIRRGADIAVARCLGADFAFIGRVTLFGVAACGEAGATRVIELLTEELDLVMGQIGCCDVNRLGPVDLGLSVQ
ncbi:MAG: alpha-hydroxy-acid oxidizing protein [Mesorhizobium sp.]|uniref:alpha-hydroxy acid oxidase n=1 Tax=Mesorhizobium sp. TaxID=1871066 RepID=UPI000FE814A9|nr:alpha-hydroxy acid oxidase [Mesorhizobium sp.]RWH94072.1 MAG: alpha-hydroxy-acid oxidizing protein [Mesorhizobium sp.]RWK82702.1 MAG: alpha-hydroxy-acid oxidizing protein [Mesorhizobium sp.]RWL06509.1 MAG: alpha-hydroxy-acid oxidizing protein [Mesorhizobium sp.]